jgi:biopolymer transport protein ExbD
MSSIEESGDSGHKKGPGVKKAKKLSTRVDMTPMVDLGFLLITFFIFTTTMSSPTTMELFMPKDTDKDEEQNKAKASGALTVMLGNDNHIFYYEGELEVDAKNFKQGTFGLTPIIAPTGDTIKPIRTVILDKKKAVIEAHQHDAGCEKIQQKAKAAGDPAWKTACLDKDLVIVIKPNQDATYKNTIDILDEMAISNIKRYAMVDLFDIEKQLIAQTEGNVPK